MMSDRDTTSNEEFDRNLLANMTFIREHLNEVPQNSRKFAQSLCEYFETYSSLSSKQLYYAAKIFNDLQVSTEEEPDYSRGRPLTKNVEIPPDQRQDFVPPRVVVNGKKLLALFDKAAETLKSPHFTYKFENNYRLAFHRTGPRSKFPGAVNIWYGTNFDDSVMAAGFTLEGNIVWASHCFGRPQLQQCIKRICENFTEELAINGRKFGICCFCSRELTDPASIAAGYGPICADKWGLPWGEVTVKELDVGL